MHAARRVIVLVTLLLALCSAARAQPALPDDLLAWCRLDFSRCGPAPNALAQHAVVDSLFTWLAPGRVLQDATTERFVRELLGDALARGAPISICVLDLSEEAGNADQAPPASLRPVRCSAVISIRAGQDVDFFAQHASELLADSLPGAGHAAQRKRITLPGEVPALEYRRPEWPTWRAITTRERAEGLDIGLGDGALARWLALPAAPDAATPLELHRRQAREARAGTESILEIFVNIDRLRRAFPDRFGDDPGAALLGALHLANARSFMLHATLPARAPGAEKSGLSPLSIDATWSVRSEARTTIHRLALTSGAGTQHTVPAEVTAFLQPAWSEWTAGMCGVYSAMLTGHEQSEYERWRRLWSTRRLPALVHLAAGLEATATLTPDRAGTGCALGGLVLTVPLKKESKPDMVQRDVRSAMEPFADHISVDLASQTWWVRLDAPNLLRGVSWGVGQTSGGRELIIAVDLGVGGDWGWNAVWRARERLKTR